MIAKISIVGIGIKIMEGPGQLMEWNAMVIWIIGKKQIIGLPVV